MRKENTPPSPFLVVFLKDLPRGFSYSQFFSVLMVTWQMGHYLDFLLFRYFKRVYQNMDTSAQEFM